MCENQVVKRMCGMSVGRQLATQPYARCKMQSICIWVDEGRARERPGERTKGKGKAKGKGKGKGQSNGQGNRRLHFWLQGYAFREHVVYNGSRAPSSLFSLSLPFAKHEGHGWKVHLKVVLVHTSVVMATQTCDPMSR